MAASISERFANLPEPRRAQGRRQNLADLIVATVTAVICAADSWSEVHEFGRARQ